MSFLDVATVLAERTPAYAHHRQAVMQHVDTSFVKVGSCAWAGRAVLLNLKQDTDSYSTLVGCVVVVCCSVRTPAPSARVGGLQGLVACIE